MGKTRKILAIIPMRGGSKRLKRKHLKILLGQPLMAYTIQQAQKSKLIDKVVVNSDDNKILAVAKGYGVETYKRDSRLAQDNSSIYDVLFDQLDHEKEYDIVVLLEATSPLRKDDDIDKAIDRFLKSGTNSLVSIGRVGLEAPNCYFPYGLLYMSKVDALKKYKTFYQNNISFYLIEDWQCEEIDYLQDFIKVEALMKNYLL